MKYKQVIGNVFSNLSENNKLLKFNQNLVYISVNENTIILKQKDGYEREFIISDVVKIYIEINKRSKLIYVIIFGMSPFVAYLYSETYWLFLMILLYANLVLLIINKFTHHKFKFKLIIKDSNLVIHYFKFDYRLKNQIVESISRVKNQIKL